MKRKKYEVGKHMHSILRLKLYGTYGADQSKLKANILSQKLKIHLWMFCTDALGILWTDMYWWM